MADYSDNNSNSTFSSRSEGEPIHVMPSGTFHTTERRVLIESMHVKSIQTAVTAAVEHLHDMSTRMSSGDVINTFNQKDLTRIDNLIAAIKDLEVERQRIHELYETETIRASKLRFKLMHFPHDYEKETADAVSSARASNSVLMKNLSDKLDLERNEIETLQTGHSQLEKENSYLFPERDEMQKKHEAVIFELNERMSEKAMGQIALNETRDQIRQNNEAIVVLEDGIIKLKDDLIIERKDVRNRKKDLKQKITDTMSKVNEQKDENTKLYGVLQDHIREFGIWLQDVDQLKKLLSELTEAYKSNKSLEEQQRKQIQLIKEDNAAIKARGIQLEKNNRVEDKEFRQRKEVKNTELDQRRDRVAEYRDKILHLEAYLERLQEEFTVKKEQDAKMVKKFTKKRKRYENLQGALMEKTDKVNQLHAEQSELESESVAGVERHRATIRQLNATIEECRVELRKERQHRINLQNQRDEISKDLSDFKYNTQQFMKVINKKITEGKIRHVELTQEGTDLQMELIKGDTDIKELKVVLKKKIEECDSIESELAKQESIIENKMEEIKQVFEEKISELELKEPVFAAADEEYQHVVEEFSSLKKEVASIKTKRNTFLEDIEKFKKIKESLIIPTERLRKMLQDRREQSLNKMRESMDQTNEMETSIVDMGGKLKKIIEENFKFNNGIESLQENLCKTEEEISQTKQTNESMLDEYDRLQKLLWEGWRKDKELQEMTDLRDSKYITDFGDVITETGKRVKKVDDITSRLDKEIHMLAEFLDKVTDRRPEETTANSQESL